MVKKITENDLSIKSPNNSSLLEHSASKDDNLNLSESVVKKLPSMISQCSFSTGKKDDLLSSVEFDIKRSKLINDNEVSTFPEEDEEYEISDENNENIFTNIQKIKNDIPVLKEGEFVLIEKETKPIIDEYEKICKDFIIKEESGEILKTHTFTRQKNDMSNDSSEIIKTTYYENDGITQDETYMYNFYRKKWKYFVKLFIIEKNRKQDEYRKLILEALMKSYFKKNNKKKITIEEKENQNVYDKDDYNKENH